MSRKSPIVSLVHLLRETFKKGRHRTGDKTLSGRRRRNPWPKCPTCFHRNPPEDYCSSCRQCEDCCEKCTRCGRCLMRCPGHPTSGQQGEQDGGKFRFSVEGD